MISSPTKSTRQCKSSMGKPMTTTHSSRFGEDIPRTFEDFLNQRDSDEEDTNGTRRSVSTRREKTSKVNLLSQEDLSASSSRLSTSSAHFSPSSSNQNNNNINNASIKFWDRKTKSFANMENATLKLPSTGDSTLHIPDRSVLLKGSKLTEIRHSLEMVMHELDEYSHFESQKERENMVLKAKVSELEISHHATLASRVALTRDEIRKLSLSDLQILKINVENTLGLIDEVAAEKQQNVNK